jgi:hypothetical protein
MELGNWKLRGCNLVLRILLWELKQRWCCSKDRERENMKKASMVGRSNSNINFEERLPYIYLGLNNFDVKPSDNG